MPSADPRAPTPIARLGRVLVEDRGDLFLLVSYACITGLLALVTPLAVQALVNNIAAGLSLQPVVVLSFLLLVGLSLNGALLAAELALVESIQQRLFARLSLRMARRLILARPGALTGTYGPELVNRFFDVVNIQKALAKILLDGFAAGLQALVGLTLLSFYDLRLFGFDLLLVIFLIFVVWPLGIGALRSSMAESSRKYQVASWLEELARCATGFKLHASPAFLIARADDRIVAWLAERRRHFAVVWRQEIGNQTFQALAGAGILAIGGVLVVQQDITLGQLVAAQLIVGAVLKAFDKLLRKADSFYDLLTGLEKTAVITDLPEERDGGLPVPELPGGGASLVCRGVRFAYPGYPEVLSGLDLDLRPGERVSLVGASGAGKSTLAALVCGLQEATAGRIEVNGVDVRAADLDSLRQVVTTAGYSAEIFEGTVEENIVCGRENIEPDRVRWALGIAQFSEDVDRMPEGLRTRLVAGGQNLSRGQIQRLMIARAVLERPALLILDEALTGLDESTSQRILDALFAPEHPWTIVDISHEPAVVQRADTVHVLADGRIAESGSVDELIQLPDGAFEGLFPALTRTRRVGE